MRSHAVFGRYGDPGGRRALRLEVNIGLKKLPGTNAFVLFPEEIEVLWDFLGPMFQRSVDKSYGMVTLDSIQERFRRRELVCSVVLRNDILLSAFAWRIVEYDTYKSLRIVAAAGKELKVAAQFLDVLVCLALKEGAVELEAWCRPAMVRLLHRYGFRRKTEIVTLDIRRKLQ